MQNLIMAGGKSDFGGLYSAYAKLQGKDGKSLPKGLFLKFKKNTR